MFTSIVQYQDDPIVAYGPYDSHADADDAMNDVLPRDYGAGSPSRIPADVVYTVVELKR